MFDSVELSARMRLLPGAVIAQRYKLERLLGEGGMGAVWSARHLLTQKRVALKFLKGPANADLTKRFVREARAASAVQHPNVIGIHDVVMLPNGLPMMVMDLLDGESLASRLERTGSIPVQELASIMLPVLSAVGAAHALGIVHRDLKPDNIFLANRGDGEIQPMVLDFGICKLNSSEALPIEKSTLTVTGSILGTPYYMAPEQVFGEKDVDARADVWALGVILYECTTGKHPVDGENVGQLIKHIFAGSITPIRKLAPNVPPEFASVVHRMLIQDRNQRAPDLRQAFDTLRAMTDVSAQSFDAATTVRIPSLTPSASPPEVATTVLSASAAGNLVTTNVVVRSTRRPMPMMLGGAAVILVLGGLGSVRLWRNPSPATLDNHQSAFTVVASQPSAVPLTISPAPSHSSLAPSASAAAPTPSASVSASASSRVRKAPPSHVRRATASSAEPETTSKPKTAPSTLAGGVHGSVPF